MSLVGKNDHLIWLNHQRKYDSAGFSLKVILEILGALESIPLIELLPMESKDRIASLYIYLYD